MTDDDPLDLEAVAADAALLDLLTDGEVSDDVSDDVRTDLGLVLLRELRADVLAEPVELEPVWTPSTSGSSVVVLAGGQATGRRTARSSAAVALLTAGVLSVGGVAAASTAAPAGSPLHGLGDAVRSVAGAFANAVTPPETAAALPSTSPSPDREPRGAGVAGTARSAAAARQVAALLDAAQQLLGAGRTAQAGERLDVAQLRLAEVLPEHGAPALAARLAALRDRIATEQAAAPPGKVKPERSAGPAHAPSGGKPAKPDAKPAKPDDKPATKPDTKPAVKPAAPRPDQPAGKNKPTERPEPDAAPERSAPAKAEGDPSKGAAPARQPSSEASEKPRA